MDIDDIDDSSVVDMGYEEHAPRRNSNVTTETERRASIKAIMADTSLGPLEKRQSIQHLMDGRRRSSNAATTPSVVSDDDNNNNNHAMALETDNNNLFVCNELTKRVEATRPPCTHYQRNCTILSPCCGAAFGCRICHDDCPILPPPTKDHPRRRYARSASLSFNDEQTMIGSPADQHHTIDRFAIDQVICRQCFTRQSSKT